jgi:twinkle protein
MTTAKTAAAAMGPLVVTVGGTFEAMCRAAGCRHVIDVGRPEFILDRDGHVRHEIDFFEEFVILIPEGGESLRDTLAIKLGDERCRWAYQPEAPQDIPNAIAQARPMWTDEIATIDDIPDPGPEQTFTSGFAALDQHGFRITLPAFMPIIGPYSSGKSVFLRQLLINLWRKHGWKFLLTSFEEKVKPRFHRDLRRHLIGLPYCDQSGVVLWTDVEIAEADAEIRQAAVFLRRKRKTVLDLERLIDRLAFAVRVHGVKIVAIDPVNEIDHVVPKGESKTDYMGKFIMALKALADDYGLLVICCAHPPKDGVEKRLSKTGLLTLNDGADTAHYGNKADIGLCIWRNLTGPSYLHGDKLKDHETMGQPFLAEMRLDPTMNQFNITRMGYDILQDDEE